MEANLTKTRKESVINVSSVPNPSPFRYPGGKSWLIPHIRQWLKSLPSPIQFVEAFAGGANVGLTVALENLAEQVTLIELDSDVAAVWRTVLNGQADALAKRITQFKMSKKAAKRMLERTPRNLLSQAFSTIVKNRVRRGGIMTEDASFLKRGEDGKGVRSRWYPETLKKRIEAISNHREKITFLHQDGVSYIRANSKTTTTAFFLDPPYTVAGARLYTHSDIDHRELFTVASEVSGNLLMCYDNSAEIRSLAQEFGFSIRRVEMKTAHHSVKKELLISRDFGWFNLHTLRSKQKSE